MFERWALEDSPVATPWSRAYGCFVKPVEHRQYLPFQGQLCEYDATPGGFFASFYKVDFCLGPGRQRFVNNRCRMHRTANSIQWYEVPIGIGTGIVPVPDPQNKVGH